MITRFCDVENAADFVRYYTGSFVGYHDKNKEKITPIFIGTLDGNNTSKVLTRSMIYKDDNNITVGDYISTPFAQLQEQIDFGRPRLGIVKDGPTIVFLSQTTPREGRKGLRIRDALINEFNSYELLKFYTRPHSYVERMDWVWQSFNPSFFNLKDALKRINEGQVLGLPVSKDIGLYVDPSCPYPMVSYKRWNIGYLRTEEMICLYSFYADYSQEIVNKTGAEVRIV